MTARGIVNTIFYIIEFAILARVIISWLPVPKNSNIIELLYKITEPILGPIRRLIEKSSFGSNMMFDISPIIALLLMDIVRNMILNIIRF